MYDSLLAKRSNISDIPDEGVELLVRGVGLNLEPANKKGTRSDGPFSHAIYQSRCLVCRNTINSNFICSGCHDVHNEDTHIFHADTKFACFQVHLRDRHHTTEF